MMRKHITAVKAAINNFPTNTTTYPIPATIPKFKGFLIIRKKASLAA